MLAWGIGLLADVVEGGLRGDEDRGRLPQPPGAPQDREVGRTLSTDPRADTGAVAGMEAHGVRSRNHQGSHQGSHQGLEFRQT